MATVMAGSAEPVGLGARGAASELLDTESVAGSPQGERGGCQICGPDSSMSASMFGISGLFGSPTLPGKQSAASLRPDHGFVSLVCLA